MSCEQVLAMETELEDEMEARDCSDLKVIQSLVNKWTPLLHSQHFLMLLLKRKLLAALKKSPPPSDENNTEYLRQIVNLCEEQLRVWDVLDPGLTLLRYKLTVTLQLRFERHLSVHELELKLWLGSGEQYHGQQAMVLASFSYSAL